MYVGVEGSSDLTGVRTYDIELHSKPEKLITELPLNTYQYVTDAVTGTSKFYGAEIDVLNTGFLLSPCLGTPALFGSSTTPYPTMTTASYYASGRWGEEVYLPVDTSLPVDKNINYFVAVDNEVTGGVEGANFSYEIFFESGEKRPVPGNRGALTIASKSSSSVKVAFAPASVFPESSSTNVEYALYAVPKATGTVDYSTTPIPGTACGMMLGGIPLMYDPNTASEWITFADFDNEYEIESTVLLDKGTTYTVNVLARDVATRMHVAYTATDFVAKGGMSTFWMWLMIIAIVLVVLGFAYAVWRFMKSQQRNTDYKSILTGE
ncbi:hypothetical protein KIPB_001435 [Kipferlia bialata]|uniref:Uncharacterized protein n=1 Tax=Kipferlia bialata TaxID=797122 RepID=A0A9K3GE47_9EUKA|nr:hypothetical protein KIPB_001435 [Kipferlia bialata]|eukprot:g1435.t1